MIYFVIILLLIGSYFAISLGLLVQTYLLKDLKKVRKFAFIVPVKYITMFIKLLFSSERESNKFTLLRMFLSIDTTMLMMLFCIADVKSGAIAKVQKNIQAFADESKEATKEDKVSNNASKEKQEQYKFLMNNLKSSYGY